MIPSVIAYLIFLPIAVETPVARRPLADPGVRNYRTGLLGGRAASATPVLGCWLVFIMQVQGFGATRESTAVPPRAAAGVRSPLDRTAGVRTGK